MTTAILILLSLAWMFQAYLIVAWFLSTKLWETLYKQYPPVVMLFGIANFASIITISGTYYTDPNGFPILVAAWGTVYAAIIAALSLMYASICLVDARNNIRKGKGL